MQIGQLAKRTHVPIDTIRYYESHGILPAPARRNSGYRSYGDADVARLHFVRRAKALGFTARHVLFDPKSGVIDTQNVRRMGRQVSPGTICRDL